MSIQRRLAALACALVVLSMAVPAGAADKYPDRPVKLMVALPAGGGVDMMARLVGQKLAAQTGQPFVVDNKARASGRIGLPLVAKPEAVNYASSGDGSPQHLAALMFETRMKVRMVHIPYKGGALAINDLLFAPLRAALPHVKAGKLTALATMREAGMDVAATTPEQFGKTLADESRLHAGL